MEAASASQGAWGARFDGDCGACCPPRGLRADAQRNRERVLQAAKLVFNAGGPGASLEAVAKHAGVGIGTLYRHFPTREALFEAVYRREVDQLVALAQELEDEASPVEALRRWMRSNIEFIATKKGMSAALALVAHGSRICSPIPLARLHAAIEPPAAARGRGGRDPRRHQPRRTCSARWSGICYTQEKPDWQPNVMRLVDVFLDGLSRPSNR